MKAFVTIVDDNDKTLRRDALVFPRDSKETALYTEYHFEFHAVVAKPELLGIKADEIIYDEWVGDPEMKKQLLEKGGE